MQQRSSAALRIAALPSTLLTVLLAACGGGGGGSGGGGSSNPPAPPVPPTVAVGTPPSVSGLERVTLTGTATDADGTVTSVEWRQLAGPPVALSTNGARVDFTAPDVETQTDVRLEFRATDDAGLQAAASVTIRVEPTVFYERVSLPFDHGIETANSILASADFTGDGFEDVIAFRFKFDQDVKSAVDVFPGSGGTMTASGGTLIDGPALTFYQPRTLEVQDFNGDGTADVFVGASGIDSHPDGEANGLLLSAPGGRLTNASDTLPLDIGYTHGSASGDIDGDGDIDIVVNNFGGAAAIDNNFVLLNDGTGVFSAVTDRLPPEMSGGGSYSTIGDSLLVDCDGDGDLDLVVGDHSVGQLSRWYANDGSGNFRHTTFTEIETPALGGTLAMVTHIQALDLSGNGRRDLVFTYYSGGANPFRGGAVAVFRNDGAGSFTLLPGALPHAVFEVGERDVWVATLEAMDWNQDGWDDIVVTNRLLDDYQDPLLDAVTPPVWLSNGDGTFRAVPQAIFPLVEQEGGRTWTVGEPVDLDGDGGADMFHLGFKWQLLRQVRPYTR